MNPQPTPDCPYFGIHRFPFLLYNRNHAGGAFSTNATPLRYVGRGAQSAIAGERPNSRTSAGTVVAAKMPSSVMM